ncbi:amidohydrolase [Nocardia ninae]|uniref:Amidohydrolase n=1 Tax=Nocardia ninae NBRC 108245 TaxID=1210091 RepID=A0A511MC09_9NOCA|nr:amidohydrolase [Nocardia ninae]GEM38203.1 amidohydrolase [Nocardia ninae NBRC 108245]
MTDSDRARLSRAQFLRLTGAAVSVAAVSGLVAACSTSPRPHPGPERILLDGVRGYTCTASGLHRFSSLLIDAHGRVEALDPAGTAGARRIDGRGRVCLPGFHDAHGHIWSFGAAATQIDLAGVRSVDDALRVIATYAREHRDRPWLLGRGWNDVGWGRLPSAADLDRVVEDRPLWLLRVDSHAGVANTAALRLAGITASTPDPAGGQIIRDHDGRPTGVLVDAAKKLIEQHIPAPTLLDYEDRLLAAQHRLNAAGLTSISEASTAPDQIAALFDLTNTRRMTLRINAFLNWDAFVRFGKHARTDSGADDMLRVRTVKLIADGALGSYGAALLDPYTDRPTSRGLPQLQPAELTSRVRQIVDAGYQSAIHAIGDYANRIALDAYTDVLGSVRGPRLRHRIEHAQVLAPPDLPRLQQLGLIASMQPSHATDDMNMAEARLGAARLSGAYAWRSLLDQGTIIAAGSDFPVSSHRPFDGIHAAVTRTDRDGQPVGGWHREQAMTVAEALRAYTLDAAYAAHQERVLGSLTPGKHADFVLLDQDLFWPQKPLWQTEVLQTWVGGRRIGEYGQL